MATKRQKNSAVRGTTARIGEERLVRLRLQNEKLSNEVRRLKGEVAPVEQIKAEVIRANTTVKTQLLALPHRLGDQMASTLDPKECGRILQEAITQCLNDLAYAREIAPETCPSCGRAMKGEPE
jgi:hypothetical protein